jgi:hypothetical protein
VNVTYTYGEVLDIANKAADLVIKELGLPDCGRRDVVNLVVNAIGSLMENPETASLDEVIRDNYSAEPEEVRSWAEGVDGW